VEALEVITKERDQLQARVEELDKALTDSRVKARESSKEVSQLTANIDRLSTEFGAREVRRVLSS
jgi:peptidoglycan hydrolase CwlO-like protein